MSAVVPDPAVTDWVPLWSLGSAAYYGTTPPGSPADGQEWMLPVADGVVWRFRYNAGSASAYKWEFIGGASLSHQISANESTTTVGSFVNLTTVGPNITIPRAGDYEFTGSASLTKNAADPVIQIALGIGDFAAGSEVGQSVGSAYAAGSYAATNFSTIVLGVAAGAVYRIRYYQAVAGTLSAQRRTLLCRPIRVS